MLKSTCLYAAAFAVIGLAASVRADEQAKTCEATACVSASCSAAGCDASGECPIAAAMKRLPQLTYAVGDEKTACPVSAGDLAKKSGDAIHYLVAAKTFEKESQAKLALVKATEEFVNTFSQTKVCSQSGKISVAGKETDCEKTAAHTAKLVKSAMGKVKMAYLVGKSQCNCPVEAKQLSEKSGDETFFVVGDQKTGCQVTARLNLARAKYQAAVQALVQADAEASKQKATSGT